MPETPRQYARNVVRHINRSFENTIYTNDALFAELLKDDLRINSNFFIALGEENGFPALGRILVQSENNEEVQNALKLLIKAITVGGIGSKYMLLRTMTLLPIADILGSCANGITCFRALKFVEAMFVPFQFAEFGANGALYDSRVVLNAIAPIFPVFERVLLHADRKSSMAATKCLGFLCKFKHSRTAIDITEYLSEHGYTRITDQIFNRYGQHLATHVYCKLLQKSPKARDCFFKASNLLRLKDAMHRHRLQDSLFFVLLRKLTVEIKSPTVRLLCDANIIDFLKQGVMSTTLRFSEFNRMQSLSILKSCASKLKPDEIKHIVDVDFFAGLDHMILTAPLVKAKLAALKIVEAILRNGWDQAMRKKTRINEYAKFVRKHAINVTIFNLTKNVAIDKRIRERATDIVNKHLL